MKSRKRDSRIQRSIFALRSFLMFFLLTAFVVTCSILLFMRHLEIEVETIRESAILTFANVILLSLLLSVMDALRRKVTIGRPVDRILKATRQITEGDFSARIKPIRTFDGMSEFDIIIEDFNKMAEELSSLETFRTDFIASVSHELKTPLSVIQNYATLLQAPGLSEEKRKEHVKCIAGASRKLSELITNILKLNSLENQQIFPSAYAYDLGEQLRECLLGFEDVWEQKSLEIETDIEDIQIKADAELLSLVWNNLFSNAIKFTPEGGRISTSLHEENGMAVVKISDTGCGMTEEVGQHIFDKFYQGDPSHATQGNGLGLSLVKRVVDITSSEISVESTVGVGSTFTVKIPKTGEHYGNQ